MQEQPRRFLGNTLFEVDDEIWSPPNTEEPVAWRGSERLRDYVVPIASLVFDADLSVDDSVAVGLDERGQVNPVLVADDGVTVVGRAWIVVVAARNGWGGVAVRAEVAELAEQEESLAQTSLLQEAELAGVSLGGFEREERQIDVDAVNEESAAKESEWVALPEFVPASAALRVVVSCANGDDRKALFDALGIRTVHKGTRGTLSVWWPDKDREDLSSLRFVDLEKGESE